MVCLRYLVVFHKVYSVDAEGVRPWRKVSTQLVQC
jgi:hypothetical protein